MIKATVIEGTEDLRPLLAALARQGVRVRVTEESGSQVIWTATEKDKAQCETLANQWRALQEQGYVSTTTKSAPLSNYIPVGSVAQNTLGFAWRAPVTAFFILAAIVVSFITGLGSKLQADSLLFFPEWMGGSAFNPLSYLQLLTQSQGLMEYVQTLTPALLHFSILHIVFNCLWLLQFGRMIEAVQSSIVFALVSIVIIYISNSAQLLWSHSVFFGGLSGLVYGLLGYIWITQLLEPRGRLRLPNSTIAILVGFMVFFAVVPLNFIANAAHIGGLVAGGFMGAVTAFARRLRSN